MDTLQFLEHVLGQDGRYCLVSIKHVNSVAVQNSISQSFYNTIDELAEAAVQKDSKGLDTYFAVGCIGNADNRKAYNVLGLKAFFLDIDCGEGKDYPTQVAGHNALREFVKTVGLPMPLLVNSGNGIHAWWVTDELIPADQWKVVAELFKAKTKAHGLKVDDQCTSDVSRILRIAGTHNRKKDEEPKQVVVLNRDIPPTTTLAEMRDILSNGEAPLFELPVAAQALMSADNLISHYTRNTSYSFEKILNQAEPCAQVKYRMENRHSAGYYEWFQMLQLATMCDADREWAIQAVSEGHDDFDLEAAIEKADTLDSPPLCSKMDSEVPDKCVGCPHQGKIKTPLLLGKVVNVTEEPVVVVTEGEHIAAEKPVVIPKYPNGYVRGKNGGVYLKIVAEGETDFVPVYDHDLYVTMVMRNKVDTMAMIRSHLPHQAPDEFPILMSQMTSIDELRKVLSSKGVVMHDYKGLRGYLTAAVKEKQLEQAAMKANDQFGWNDKKDEFVWGEWVYRKYKDPEPNLPTPKTAGLMAALRPTGKPEIQRRCMDDFAGEGMELAQATIMYMLGAPLMAFTGINMSALNVFSPESGLGKTTIGLVGLNLWGRPKNLCLSANDTHNARMHMTQVLRNAPIMIDELTNANGKFLSNMIYDGSSGNQRSRMHSSSNDVRDRGEEWFTTMVTTSNDSLIDLISANKTAPDAEAQRMLEVRMRPLKKIDSARSYVLTNELNANYGHTIGEYIQYIVDHSHELEGHLVKMREEIDKKAGLTSNNRFWSAGWACALLAGMIGNKLGMFNFDIRKVRTFVIEMLVDTRTNLKTMTSHNTAKSLISRFWNEHVNQIIAIDGDKDARENGNGLDIHNMPHLTPKGGMVGRYEPDSGKLFIAASALKKWCSSDGVKQSYTDLRNKSVEELGAVIGNNVRLGKGTPYAIGATRVWEFNVDKLGMEDADDSVDDRANSA